jgi:hypothetical protein
MVELERFQQVVRVVRDDRGVLAAAPMFGFIDAVYRHVASEELLFGESSNFSPPPEWGQHRVHHARARLCCFWLATCNEADRGARFEHLQSVLCDHARHEMLLLSGLVRVLRAPHRVA